MIKNKITLFTIPFAGGNKFSFQKFNPYLEEHFNVHHLELAGRGKRISENLMDNVNDVVEDLLLQIKGKTHRDYILYGHSLGGLLGYLLILRLEENGLHTPSRFIVSGRANPCLKPSLIRHNLPKDKFIHSLQKLGGMPSEFFNHPELFDFFEPILRADFQVVESFHFAETRKINTKLSLLYGNNELFSLQEALKWQDFVSQEMDFYQFEGGHFFIFDHIEEICTIITHK